MKKLFVTLVLAIGSMGVVMPTYATPVAQVCDSNSPCLYTGEAKTAKGTEWSIVVKYDTRGKIVAQTNKGTYYVFKSESEKDKAYGSHYFSYDGRKWYFNM